MRTFSAPSRTSSQEEGVAVGPHDTVPPAPSAPVDDGSVVEIRRGRLVTLTVDGVARDRSGRPPHRRRAHGLARAAATRPRSPPASRSQRIPLTGLAVDVRLPKLVTIVARRHQHRGRDHRAVGGGGRSSQAESRSATSTCSAPPRAGAGRRAGRHSVTRHAPTRSTARRDGPVQHRREATTARSTSGSHQGRDDRVGPASRDDVAVRRLRTTARSREARWSPSRPSQAGRPRSSSTAPRRSRRREHGVRRRRTAAARRRPELGGARPAASPAATRARSAAAGLLRPLPVQPRHLARRRRQRQPDRRLRRRSRPTARSCSTTGAAPAVAGLRPPTLTEGRLHRA